MYYYGARYLDPRYSSWISTDPALGEYIPGAGKATAGDAGSLPGMGGIFNTVNLRLYHYAGNSPVRYTDPDGRFSKESFREIVRAASVNYVSVKLAQSGNFPNKNLGFYFDASEGVYHATFDCWQRYGGYNDLYDKVFDLGTSMEAAKFEFSSGRSDYCLWGWKGDYLNLGAGCEIGLYRKAEGKLGHYYVDLNLAMEVMGTLTVNGQKAGTYDSEKLGKHWWPTIFNPSKLKKSKDEIHAQYNLTMPNEFLYNDFKRRWRKDSRFSNWNDKNHSFTVDY